MIYKLDGNCIDKCPPEYESKDLYGEKNICSLIMSITDCSNFDKCENDGECSQELGSPICKCKYGFYGKKCEYNQTTLENMRMSLNTNIDSISTIDPLIPLSDQQLTEITNISNLINNIPQLATDKLNKSIANIVFRQIQSMLDGSIPYRDYAFSIADSSLEVKNAL